MMMYYGLQSPNCPVAKGEGDFLCYFTMPSRVFFPDKAAEIFPAIVEVRFYEGLESPLVGGIYVCAAL